MSSFAHKPWIADASTWSKVRYAPEKIKNEWANALRAGNIYMFDFVMLELMYTARSQQEFKQALSYYRNGLPWVPLNSQVVNTAVAILEGLSENHQHRSVQASDALICAAASQSGIGVLHYDEDFERAAKLIDLEHQWLAPRGSLK